MARCALLYAYFAILWPVYLVRMGANSVLVSTATFRGFSGLAWLFSTVETLETSQSVE
jgi:hypothetical protein